MNRGGFSTISLGSFALTLAASGLTSAPAATGERSSNDCGPSALYALLKLDGRPTSLERIVGQLPPPRSDGYSMKELRDASWALGLRLDGVYVGKDPDAIDRPVIAFLKVGRMGHFLVARPVGHTGKLIQVIDPDQPPRVMDRSDFVASRQWTGLIFTPSRSPLPIQLAGLLVASALIPWIATLAYRRRTAWKGRAAGIRP